MNARSECTFILQIPKDFNFVNVAGIIWACATAGHPITQGSMARLVNGAMSDISTAQPQTLCNILAASAKMGLQSDQHKQLIMASLDKVHLFLVLEFTYRASQLTIKIFGPYSNGEFAANAYADLMDSKCLYLNYYHILVYALAFLD